MHSLFHSRESQPAPVITTVPTGFPEMEGANIGAVFAGNLVAGDFYDSVRVSPERVLFGLMDVAGRHDDNRAVLAAAQGIFRTKGTELFSRLDLNESEAMTELSLHINRTLIESSVGVHPCPAFIGCYHEKFGTLCYTNAGHTPGLLREQSGITELDSTGLPLGLFSHSTTDAPTIGLAAGTTLLLASRGVIACEGQNGHSAEPFGLERLKDLFRSSPTGDAETLCAFILNGVTDFASGRPQCDDRTALALVRTS